MTPAFTCAAITVEGTLVGIQPFILKLGAEISGPFDDALHDDWMNQFFSSFWVSRRLASRWVGAA
jgi:hypothetical protein